ncbi:hypothetical protein NKJ73_33730 [Mesorhizobium sp. M0074]|uniref:hypothetical protein n=1 Tax=unclassified Mesorhizobium TaxID=325217 RepID=UPI00333A2258
MKEVLIRVRIRYPNFSESLSMQSWQFGEHLWVALRNNNRVRIDLDEIDRGREEISFLVRDTYLSKALKVVERVRQEHRMENEAVIETEPA